ncbi:MAG: hypothetical protein KC464_21820, partial [Myxococcales bacterium]|nr:hypothetical protein [Myxococcales bacterium]
PAGKLTGGHAQLGVPPGKTERPPAPRPTTPVELKGKPTFEPSDAWRAYIEDAGHHGTDVDVKFGTLATGAMRVRRRKDHHDGVGPPAALALRQPFLDRLPEAVRPVLAVELHADKVTGEATVGEPGGKVQAAAKLYGAIADHADALGMVGFKLPRFRLTNQLRDGQLTIGTAKDLEFKLAGWLDGSLGLQLVDDRVAFDAHVAVRVRGLAEGALDFKRDPKGVITGEVKIAAQIAKLSGDVTGRYVDGDVSITGTLTYTSDKFKGSVGVIVADVDEAQQAARGHIDPEHLIPDAQLEGQQPGKQDGKKGKGKSHDKGVAAWGELDFAFTDWLTGKAQVVVGPTGYITVIGKIAPPKSIELIKEKPYNTRLFGTDIKARYGVPYVADIHVGIGIELGATARIGPAVLTDMAIEGVYSTDPAVLNSFTITGAFRMSAYAGLTLRFEGKAGLTLLGHDIDFGAGITAKAGIKGYAEAKPTLGYREKADPAAGKKGEYFLKGHLEIAAQPFLGLSGDLFVKLDSPWWSPAPDKTWTWPLFSLEYPLPGAFGVAADVDHVVGSDTWPEIKWGKASFDASKFTDSLLDDNIPKKKVGGDVQKPGT